MLEWSFLTCRKPLTIIYALPGSVPHQCLMDKLQQTGLNVATYPLMDHRLPYMQKTESSGKWKVITVFICHLGGSTRLCVWSFALLSIATWMAWLSSHFLMEVKLHSMQMTSHCFGRSVGRMTSSSSSMTSHWLRIG